MRLIVLVGLAVGCGSVGMGQAGTGLVPFIAC
jgi:hypothetical protein